MTRYFLNKSFAIICITDSSDRLLRSYRVGYLLQRRRVFHRRQVARGAAFADRLYCTP